MRQPTPEQILHINQMYLDKKLSYAQFVEFNQMAKAEGVLTREICQAIIAGTFKFQNRLSDEQMAKARRVWEKIGPALGCETFEKYLLAKGLDSFAPVPLMPSWPAAWGTMFNRDALVDGRIVDKVGRKEACRLLGLLYNGQDDTLVAHDEAHVEQSIRWMRGQAGHKNHNRKPSDCRASFVSGEVGMNATEGSFTWLDDPKVINGHFMDLPGSVRAGDRGDCACLGDWGGRPELSWDFGDGADPNYGSASRGECVVQP